MASALPTSLMRTIMGCILASALWLLNVKPARARQTTASTRIVTFRYVFMTSGSPYCSRYRSAARVISGLAFVCMLISDLQLPGLQHGAQRHHCDTQAAAAAAGMAA